MENKKKSEKVKEQQDVGEIGENFSFKFILPKFPSHKVCVDTRGTQLEKDKDIDALLFKTDEKIDINDLNTQNDIKERLSYHILDGLEEQDFYAIEIKTDKRITETGNIVYDITSHDKPGGLARSECDFLIYVFLNENNQVCKYSIINMFKLREYIRVNCNLIGVEGSGLKYKDFQDEENEKDGNSLLLLINIYKLKENNIATIKEVNGTL